MPYRTKKIYLGFFFLKLKKLQRKSSHDPCHMGDTFAYQFTVVNNAYSEASVGDESTGFGTTDSD